MSIKTKYEANANTNAFTDSLKASVESLSLGKDRALSDGYVLSATDSTPPVSPTNGDVYIVGSTPTGDWNTHENELAIYVNGGWEFHVPILGWSFYDQANAVNIQWNGTSWVEFAGAGGGGGGTTYTYTPPAWSGATVTISSVQAISAGVTTTIAWSTVDESGGWTNLGTNDEIITIPAGVTRVSVSAGLDGASVADQLVMSVVKNGSVIVLGDETDTAGSEKVSGARLGIPVTAGDTFELRAFSTTARDINVAGTYLTVVATEFEDTDPRVALGIVERTYTDILTITAAASGTWNIPDNCIHLVAHCAGAINSAAASIQVSLSKESDGTNPDQEFSDSYMGASTMSNLTGTTGSSYILNQAADTAGGFGFNADVWWPRDTARETRGYANLVMNDSADNFVHANFKTVSAEDHDELVVECSAGTITATVDITYTLLEAEVGYKQALYNADTTLTLADVPVSGSINAASNTVELTLPAAAPVKTVATFTVTDITNTVTVAPATGETINGITDGTFTFSGSSYEQISFERVESSAGVFGWAVQGSGTVT